VTFNETMQVYTCDNGGGSGRNWLYTEFLDLRQRPQEWMEILPDNSECHDQSPGSTAVKQGRPSRCKDTATRGRNAAFCDQRFEDFQGDFKLGRQLWRNFSFETIRHDCEHDNRCLLVDLAKFGAVQGALRCVPKVQAADPRFQKSDQENEFSKRTADHFFQPNDVAQEFYAKWQRAVTPYMGGVDGSQKANHLSGSQDQLMQGYRRTGDICYNYHGDQLPKNRVRCVSQQFRFLRDEGDPILCAGFNPATLGNVIINKLLLPVVNKLPGRMGQFLGPAMAPRIGQLVGYALDLALSSGFFIPMLAPLGWLYKNLADAIEVWIDFSIRNLLTQANPRALMSHYMGASDWALDKTQARMKRVYYDEDCDASVHEHETGCPESIPVRHAYMSAARGGDFSDSVFTSGWPGRFWVHVGVYKVRVAFIKSSVCLKIPICDTFTFPDGGVYAEGGMSLDCSGHGSCRWNMKSGNQCYCDKGYWHLKERQWCCPVGKSKEQCESAALASGKFSKPEDGSDESLVPNSTVLESIQLEKAVVDVIQSLVTQEVDQALNMSLSKSQGRKLLHLSESDRYADEFLSSVKKRANDAFLGHGPDGTKRVCGKASVKKGTTLSRMRDAMLTPAEIKVLGKDEISIRCQGLKTMGLVSNSRTCRSECCKRAGCMEENGVCKDATVSQCAVKKNMVDCIATRAFAPVAMAPGLDEICGQQLYGQCPYSTSGCNLGLRTAQTCKDDLDCPLTPLQVKYANATRGLGNNGKTATCCKDEPGSCGRKAYVGCMTATMMKCKDAGVMEIAAMAV